MSLRSYLVSHGPHCLYILTRARLSDTFSGGNFLTGISGRGGLSMSLEHDMNDRPSSGSSPRKAESRRPNALLRVKIDNRVVFIMI